MNQTDATNMAQDLLNEHAPGWTFAFDNARRRFGCCRFRDRTITLSRYLVALNDERLVRNTILHEIAHVHAGPKAKHGPVWRERAVALNISPERCYNSREVAAPTPSFVGTCPNCGHTVRRHRRTRIACGDCCRKYNGGRFDAQYWIEWRRA